MSKRILHQRLMILLSGATLILSACASGGAAYRPIVDAPNDPAYAASYEADLTDCRAVAEQRNYTNSDVKTKAIVSAGAGALIGVLDNRGDDLGNAAAGALIGGLVGGGSGALETRTERKQIVKRCMVGRGHRVLG